MVDILENIYQSSFKFLSTLSLEDTYQVIVKEAVRLTNTEWGTIFLANRGVLSRAYTTLPQLYQGNKLRKIGYTYKTFKTGRPYKLTGPRFNKNHHMYAKGIKTLIFVPLYYNNVPTGSLNLLSTRETDISDKLLQDMRLFGTMASLAIRKAQFSDETQKALSNRDLFLSIASHELKTPLTSIYIYVQLLRKRFSDVKVPETKWINNLAQETDRLTKLVNELLHIDQVKTGSLRYFKRKCSLEDIIQKAISDSQLIYPDHLFILENKIRNGNSNVLGDFDKLLQVVINLLNNAAKFSTPKSTINITLSTRDPYVILKIKDTGKGIPKKELGRVFDIFYKGEKSYKEGMGLGLFLVKKIVEKHQGEVSIRSELNKGSTVDVKLLQIKK